MSCCSTGRVVQQADPSKEAVSEATADPEPHFLNEEAVRGAKTAG